MALVVSPLSALKKQLTAPLDLRRLGIAWAISFAAWFALDILVQAPSYSFYREKGMPVPWARFVADYCDDVVWAFFTPFILKLIAYAPVNRRSWTRTVPLHALAGLIAGLLWAAPAQASRLVIGLYMDDPWLTREVTPAAILRFAIMGIALYVQVCGIGHGIYYAREYRDRDLSASRLKEQLAQAQLQVLRMQLHPHFLFNTLNTISALIHKDAAAADRMLALLGDLLRDSFQKIGAHEVSLKQEIDFLDRYLEIERTRFQDRLVVEKRIDPDSLDARVPNLILQPLVENAIRHGISRRAGIGQVEVSAHRDNGMLAISIRDNGPGLPNEDELTARGGIGLANSQARLEQLYGPAHRFELRNRPEGGLEVVLAFPFRVFGGPVLEEGSLSRRSEPGNI